MREPVVPQAGAIPVRVGLNGVEVLLITSSRRKRWILPKGMIDPGHGPLETAAMEAWEESGVRGEVQVPSVGFYRYERSGIKYQVEMFALDVLEEHSTWPEVSRRQRRWLSMEDACTLIDQDALRELLTGLPKWLASHMS